MSRAFRFYDEVTGVIHERSIVTDTDAVTAAKFAALNAPRGHVAIEGQYDHLSQRVDIATSTVIDYQPPAPSADHEWNTATKRWVVKAAVTARAQAKAAALAQIAVLEAKGIRAGREAQLGMEGAQERLKALDYEIAGLRAQI
jgi:hypothetical protein